MLRSGQSKGERGGTASRKVFHMITLSRRHCYAQLGSCLIYGQSFRHTSSPRPIRCQLGWWPSVYFDLYGFVSSVYNLYGFAVLLQFC